MAIDNLSGSAPIVRNSVLGGVLFSIRNQDPATQAYLAYTQLLYPVNGLGFSCVGAYNADFVTLGADCQ